MATNKAKSRKNFRKNCFPHIVLDE
ncbi:hypothetical protein RSAG8_13713, partial [Rhizoctonia solani AG-8 WAC10335]